MAYDALALTSRVALSGDNDSLTIRETVGGSVDVGAGERVGRDKDRAASVENTVLAS